MNSKPLRLVLSAEQSAAIRESGIRFAVIHPDSFPSPTNGRWLIDLIECDQSVADSAVRVAMGRSKERRIKTRLGIPPSKQAQP